MTNETKSEIIEVEATEVVESPSEAVETVEAASSEEVADSIRCAYRVVLTEKGNLSIEVEGKEQSLLLLDSMVTYARKTIDKKWKEQLDL
ncbi:hypothetical protein_gp039 [Bacillus phage vB_BceM_WH1]|nr:hypothetical protein_gp039 [Bacillus phage vB_BceM_WH1]